MTQQGGGHILSIEARKYVFGIILAAAPILVAAGWIVEGQIDHWIGLATAVLAVGSSGLAAANVGGKGVETPGEYRAG